MTPILHHMRAMDELLIRSTKEEDLAKETMKLLSKVQLFYKKDLSNDSKDLEFELKALRNIDKVKDCM